MSTTNLTGEQLEILKSIAAKMSNGQVVPQSIPGQPTIVNQGSTLPGLPLGVAPSSLPKVAPPTVASVVAPVVAPIVATTMTLLGYTVQKKHVYIAAIIALVVIGYLVFRWWKNKKSNQTRESYDHTIGRNFPQHPSEGVCERPKRVPVTEEVIVAPTNNVEVDTNNITSNDIIGEENKENVVQELEN